MKTLIFSICFYLFVITLSTAQEKSLNEFVREYRHRDGIRNFTIPGFLVRLAGNIALSDEDKMDQEAIRPLMRDIGGVSILIASDEHRISHSDFRRLRSDLLDEQYEPLISVRDGNSTVEIFGWEKKDVTRRLVFMIQDDDDDSVLITLRGYFTADSISKFIDHYKDNDKCRKL